MGKLCRVQEFAKLAGITSKALRHYERVGLLKPARSNSGYRLYSERDFNRLEQIVALRFLGLPLREIRTALERTPEELPEALRMQRRALLEKQAQVARAIRAIEATEGALASDSSAGPTALQKLIEVIRLQNAAETMRRYYTRTRSGKREGNITKRVLDPSGAVYTRTPPLCSMRTPRASRSGPSRTAGSL